MNRLLEIGATPTPLISHRCWSVLSRDNLSRALRQVRRNKSAPC